MTNIHRLPPMPKVRRHGVVHCEISDELTMRDLRIIQELIATAGHSLIGHGVLRIERAKRGGNA